MGTAYPKHPIYERMWKTKQSRYEAARRLKRRNRMSLCTISVLSIYAIALSLVQLVAEVPQQINNYVDIATMLFAIAVLVVSAIEAGANYSVRADALHRSANEIAFLADRFASAYRDGGTDEQLEQNFMRRYHMSLSKYQDNHETIDYRLISARASWEAKNTIWAAVGLLRAQVAWWLHAEFFYWLAMVLPGTILLLISWRYLSP